MARFIKGQVVRVPFPFTDLSSYKKRPALVISQLLGDDIILCAITTQNRPDNYSIQLSSKDFDSGGLPLPSNIRPNLLFTADSNIVDKLCGKISGRKISEVLTRIIQIISN